VVVVTHDRGFADTVADELLVLRNLKIERFKGNLSTYESERIKKAKWLTEMKDAQEKQKSHMQQSIVNAQTAAKRSGDDKKLKQAASRQKKLDERMGMQVNAKGHRFKLNRDQAGYHNSSHAAIVVPDFDPPVRIKFPPIPPDLRFPGSLVNLENISYAYPASKGKKGPEILKDISLTIHPGERVGVCGLNGSGKTTLVSLVMGTADHVSSSNAVAGLMPTKGTVTRHPRAKFARFSQQVVEELEDFGVANPEVSSLKHLMDIAEGHLAEKEARATLGSLGLQGAIASDVPIAALSGGQKVRLAFAKLVWSPPHLLVLDEVT
jgi:ATP-binding cassette subfamily F protein 3